MGEGDGGMRTRLREWSGKGVPCLEASSVSTQPSPRCWEYQAWMSQSCTSPCTGGSLLAQSYAPFQMADCDQ